MSDALDARTTHLILVHGTWGRGFFTRDIKPTVVFSEEATTGAPTKKARIWRLWQRLRWFEPGSVFRSRLADDLRAARIDFVTRLLLWNGNNSITSRSEAALVLANLIGELAAAQPENQIVIIAHSHGGNIALRAAYMAGSNCVRNLRIVTLATPFVQIHVPEASGKGTAAKKEDAGLDLMRRSWMAIRGAPVLIGLMFLAVTYRDAMRALLQPIILIDPFAVAAIAVVAAGLLVGYRLSRGPIKLVANPRPASSPGESSHDAGTGGWTNKPERLAEQSRYAAPPAGKDWLLVLRGIDDEASLTLAAGAIGNRVAHFVLGRALPAAQEALALICGLVPLAALAGWFWEPVLAVFPVIALAFAAIAALSVVISPLPGIFRSVYGRELLFGGWRCEIAANSSPDSTDGVQVITLPAPPETSKRSLRHALYMNAEAPPCILKWLQTGARG